MPVGPVTNDIGHQTTVVFWSELEWLLGGSCEIDAMHPRVSRVDNICQFPDADGTDDRIRDLYTSQQPGIAGPSVNGLGYRALDLLQELGRRSS